MFLESMHKIFVALLVPCRPFEPFLVSYLVLFSVQKVGCSLNCIECPDRNASSTCLSLKSHFKTRTRREVSKDRFHREQCFQHGKKMFYKQNCGKGAYRVSEGKLHHQRIFRAPVNNEFINSLISQLVQNHTSKLYWEGVLKSHQDKGSFNFTDTHKSCAFIASGETLLDHEYGASIDSHDIVIRSNGPFHGFEKFIGERTDVLIVRQGRAKKMRGLEEIKVIQLCILLHDQELPSSCQNITTTALDIKEAWNFWKRIYEAYMNDDFYKSSLQGKHAPSGGSAVFISLLNSGMCENWSIYGVSPVASGHYFARLRKKPVSWVHLVGLEFYVYTKLESSGFLCVV